MASSEQAPGAAAMTRSATEPDGELLLGLDTSADAAVALCRHTAAGPVEVIGRARSGDGRRHAETLVPMIRSVLADAGAQMRQVDTIVVGTGPAPFTGLRVGLATARSLARARGIEAFGVCSLDGLALAAGRAIAGDGTREVLVVSDARRREVYYGRYRTGGADVTTLTGPGVAAPADVAAEHADLVAAGVTFGPALALYGEILAGEDATDAGVADVGHSMDPAAPVTKAAPVDPADLVRLAVVRRTAGGDLSLTPRYLRRPDVHVTPGRKRATS